MSKNYKFCEKCGTKNNVTDRYCQNCGKKFNNVHATKKSIIIGIVVVGIVLSLCLLLFMQNSQEVCGSAGISVDEFEEIDYEDSNFDVNDIIANDGEWDDDATFEKCAQEISNEEHDSVYTYTYKYIGEKGGYALITYEADYSNSDLFVLPTVSKKEQFNLK